MRPKADADHAAPVGANEFSLDNRAGVGHNAGMSTVLAKELETYRRVLPGLLADPEKNGKYVLIHDDVVAGVFATQKEAIEIGYETFGLVPLLAKQIVEREEPLFFPRILDRCQSSPA